MPGYTELSQHASLYKTKAWRRLRLQVLTRDLWACKRCGVPVSPGRSGERAAIVDHITAHKGNLALFHDPTNLQTLCKRCHDSAKQGEERRGYSTAVGEDGWPTDPRHPSNAR